MTFEEIQQKLQTKFPQGIQGVEDTVPEKSLKINPSEIVAVIRFMKEEMQFETLGDLCGLDYPALSSSCVAYHLQSYTHKKVVRLKCYLPRENASIDSLTCLFKAADWLEREAFDMFGIHFNGHPDLRRILCPEDWVGHPLRKDYQTPDYYNGMPVPLYFDNSTEPASGSAKT
ncbi:NADH-quinone oxidoreductase subunit C [bacterium]|nr:NADH-quinone oxidoreductase subunit C [bacterium]